MKRTAIGPSDFPCDCNVRLTASDWQRLLVQQGCGQLISWIWLPKANAQGQADAARVQGPGSKANAQGQADAASVQGPGSEANAQGQADAARVQGPVSESNASGQADAQGSQASSAADPASWSSSVQRSDGPSAYKWETDTHEWVQRDCWACTDCGSMNLRFTQWCNCGKQREYQQERREGDWVCYVCGNLNFQWRWWCAWSDCRSKDWASPLLQSQHMPEASPMVTGS